MSQITLPVKFKEKMHTLLGAEFPLFMQGYSLPRSHGLRINTLKIEPDPFSVLAPFVLRQVPWLKEGFYYSSTEHPGKHPYHAAGLYYIQEPSAMAVGQMLEPQPGERVLDLCAAPGGKSTHIAAKMQGKGILVANEFIPSRAKILAENIERMGVTNAVILNEQPQKLSKRFLHYFDRILVDAPCSGEGMFRKDPDACREWSLDGVSMCAERQHQILAAAIEMLRPGGTLVYSTCTFSPEENEAVIGRVMDNYSYLELVSPLERQCFSPGRPEWVPGNANPALAHTLRIWPHLQEGEGHFIALLRANNDSGHFSREEQPYAKLRPPEKDALLLWQGFFREHLESPNISGNPVIYGEQLYISPLAPSALDGLKVVRPGWHLGTLKKKRFEPSHALALGIKASECLRKIDFAAHDRELFNYLKGETLDISAPKGWNLVCVSGYPLGWGKYDGQQLKNHYPKGLRWLGKLQAQHHFLRNKQPGFI